MCDKCYEKATEIQAQAGVEALEALANGEEVAERPAGPAIPVLAIELGDKVGILTSREGWEALQKLMATFGGVYPID